MIDIKLITTIILILSSAYAEDSNTEVLIEQLKTVSNSAAEKQNAQENQKACFLGNTEACNVALKSWKKLGNLNQENIIHKKLCLNGEVNSCNTFANNRLSVTKVQDKDFQQVIKMGCSLVNWKNKASSLCVFEGLQYQIEAKNNLATKLFKKACLNQRENPISCLLYVTSLKKIGKPKMSALLMSILSKNKRDEIKIELSRLRMALEELPVTMKDSINDKKSLDQNSRWLKVYLSSTFSSYDNHLARKVKYNSKKVSSFSLKLLKKYGDKGEAKKINLLLALGIDPEIRYGKKGTPLFFNYYYQGREDIYHAYERYGANINSEDKSAWSPLFYATLGARKKTIKHLAELGANLDKVDKKGMTSLMYAATKGNLEIVKELHLLGANLNTTSILGNTALIHAVKRNNYSVSKYLVRSGAYISTKTKQGFSARSFAKKKRNSKMINILSTEL